MENQKYYQLLEYLQEKQEKKKKKYREWAEQFYKKGEQVYKEDRKIIPKLQVLRVISIFHDLLMVAYQSKNVV